MIRAIPPGEGLLQRLRLRAERIAARHLQGVRRRRRRKTRTWHSPAALWPDFTDDNTRI
jgi:hypothetical protein